MLEEISDEKEDIEMQRLLRILLCFSCFGLLKLNAYQELMEMNFRKKNRCFCSQDTHSQKPLSFLQQLSRFERFSLIFAAYFSGILNI